MSPSSQTKSNSCSGALAVIPIMKSIAWQCAVLCHATQHNTSTCVVKYSAKGIAVRHDRTADALPVISCTTITLLHLRCYLLVLCVRMAVSVDAVHSIVDDITPLRGVVIGDWWLVVHVTCLAVTYGLIIPFNFVLARFGKKFYRRHIRKRSSHSHTPSLTLPHSHYHSHSHQTASMYN
jgi:hypothetical protein